MRHRIHRLAWNFSRTARSEFNNRRTRRINAILGKTDGVCISRPKNRETERKRCVRRKNTRKTMKGLEEIGVRSKLEKNKVTKREHFNRSVVTSSNRALCPPLTVTSSIVFYRWSSRMRMLPLSNDFKESDSRKQSFVTSLLFFLNQSEVNIFHFHHQLVKNN